MLKTKLKQWLANAYYNAIPAVDITVFAKMKQLITVLFTVWLLQVAGFTQAKPYYGSVEKISVDDGLPDSTVYSIATDDSGFLWFGMSTALARYDGYLFHTFSHSNADINKLAVDSAGNIFIDSQQRMWVGTWGEGLVLYDQDMKLVAHFRHDKRDPWSIGSNMVQEIFEDSEGDIWIGTNGGGLALYQPDRQSFISYQFDAADPTSLSHNRVWSIAETDKGIIWVATSDGLNRLEKNKSVRFTRFMHDPAVSTSINHVLVRSLLVSKKGELWVGTEKGFGHFDIKSEVFTAIPFEKAGNVEAITRMIEDHKGGIWIGTQGGLLRYEPKNKQLTELTDRPEFQLFRDNDIRDLLIDESGVLWVATRYAGLIKINLTLNRFGYYQSYIGADGDERLINKVHSLYASHSLEGEQNDLWMGVANGLLRMDMQTQKIERFDAPVDLSVTRVKVIAGSLNSKLWLGSSFGLSSFDTKTRQFSDEMALLSPVKIKQVKSLLVDRQGSLWIGTAHEGLLKYDGDTNSDGDWQHFRRDDSDPNSLSSDAIDVLFEDQQGRIWVGTEGGGLNRFDPRNNGFVKYLADSRQPTSISDNVVKVIYQTRDGQMWFGTPKSLDKLDEVSAEFTHFGIKNGLVNSNIKGMIEDDQSDLWISTDKGLSQFKYKRNHFSNFSDKDSLHSNEFLLTSVAKSRGRIYFGGNAGIHEIVPTRVTVNKHIPKVAITDIWLDDKPLEQLAFRSSETLVVSHEVSSIALRFAALDFQAPGKNRYSYKLQGVEEDWQQPDESRIVTYRHLPPGSYTFSVTGSNNSNQWNPVARNLVFVITPPWWTLLWFKAAVGVGLLIFAYLWYRFRRVTIAGREKLLEVEVVVRTAEVNLQKDELTEALQRLNVHTKSLETTNEELSQHLAKTEQYQQQQMEEQKMAALGNMVAGISHEINTPIGLGITATSLMQDRMEALKLAFDDGKLSAKQLGSYLKEGEQSLEIIYRNLEKAADMIRSFKQVSADKSTEEVRNFGLSQLINEVLFSMQSDLKKVRHQVEVACDDAVRLNSKPGLLSQILVNLINNSLIHAFDGVEHGLMTINVSVIGHNCELIYRDNGNGVPSDIEKQIFEPFVTGKKGTSGTGLGMHLVYNLATGGLGGTIAMDPNIDAGVEFKLLFPVTLKPDNVVVEEPAEVVKEQPEEYSEEAFNQQNDGYRRSTV